MISVTVPARVGILGNPSDGYGGRTLSLALPRFGATVTLEAADRLEIVENEEDRPVWSSVGELVDRIDRQGYGTGPQLLAAAVRTFADVAHSVEHRGFPGQTFRLGYSTTIPRQVGLGGSSALVIATLRALGQETGLELPPEVLPSIALRAETEQLGITAGLQDRVIQTYGGLVSMNFGEMTTDARFGVSHGEYRGLDPAGLPPLFLAYRERSAEPSGTYHRTLRDRFDRGDGVVREGLKALAGLVVEGEAAVRWGSGERLAELIDRNMGIRRTLAPIPESQLDLVDAVGDLGFSATFAGSGGAIVGVHAGPDDLDLLTGALAARDATVVPISV
ncbi:MAG: GHMP kinase [Actinomycetota bacterium]